MEVIWETFALKVTILRSMVAICGVCVRYAVNMGSGWGPRAESTWKFKVIPLARGPLATSKQIAGNPENRKTEIRTPQYARRQDRQLQNGTEWQEDKRGRKVSHSRVPRGAGGFFREVVPFRLSNSARYEDFATASNLMSKTVDGTNVHDFAHSMSKNR